MPKPPDLTKLPRESSVVHGYHYEPNTRDLHVQFPSGDIYRYRDVPMEKVASMLETESPGRYFGAKIRGFYNGKKVAP